MKPATSHIAFRLCCALFAAAIFVPAIALADQTVRCESTSGQQQWCNADTSGGVELRRQISSAGCWEGRSWGYSNRGIWVSNGCRADFQTYGGSHSSNDSGEQAAVGLLAIGILGAVIANRNNRPDEYHDDGYYPPDAHYDDGDDYGQPPVVIRCESRSNRQQRCNVDTRGADVQISRQLSSANCQLGYNWGFDRAGIWVGNGCRAEFTLYYR